MKSLLFSMPDIYPRWTPNQIKGPNLALASIAGNCLGHKVYVGDLILKRKNIKKAIKKAIKKYSPQVIGLSAMTFQFPTLIRVARFIKKIDPSILIVIGGYHVTVLYKQVVKKDCSGYFDFIMRGEADLSFNELLNELESEKEFYKIKGLSYKKDNKWFHNPSRPLENLEDIRVPDRNSRIWKGYHFLSEKYDTIETSRGCFNYCKFCSIREMYGHSYRRYSINRIIQDIKSAEKRGIKYLFFVDDNFTCDARDMKWFNTLLDAIIENRLNDIQYATQASSIGMGWDERIIKKMRKAGFDFVFLGMENISPENLKYYKKGNIINYTKRAVKFLRDNRIIIMGGLVMGMEEDREDNFKLNFKYLIESKVDNLMAQVLTPYPGTELRNELMQKGLITNKNNWKTYCGYFANIKTNYLSTKELDFLQWKYSNQYYKWRIKKIWNLNIFKNHPYHCIKTAFIELIKNIPLFIKKIGKNEMERFEIDFEYKLNLNKDLI